MFMPSANELIITNGNISAKATAPAPLAREGGLDWTVTFNSKPARNYWDIPIGKTDLKLVYQSPLTEKFVEADCDIWTPTHVKTKSGLELFRTIDMVGGYVAYHSKLRNNQYQTGKLFNLLAPKVVDQNGMTAYGTYNRNADETNILRVTLPQSFLDSAVYPITLDPNFGYDTLGGSNFSTGGASRMFGNFWSGFPGGTVTRARAGVGNGANLGKVAVYDDPTQVSMGVTNEGNVPGGASVWVYFDFASTFAMGAGGYFLMFGGDGSFNIAYDDGLVEQEGQTSGWVYPTFPDPASITGTGSFISMSIYLEYTPTAAAPASGTFLTCLWK